jgi:hypothetical protein
VLEAQGIADLVEELLGRGFHIFSVRDLTGCGFCSILCPHSNTGHFAKEPYAAIILQDFRKGNPRGESIQSVI